MSEKPKFVDAKEAYISYRRELERKYYEKHVALGQCVKCTQPAETGYTRCDFHLQKDKISSAKYHKKRKAKVNE